jgi:O-antigen/teichoic acid export membrane protein
MTSLAQRSVNAFSWSVAANLTSIAILFMRTVTLARLIPVTTFGVYAGASAVVTITAVVAGFGLGGALLHRSPYTEDEGSAAAQHFTLRLIATGLWATLMVGFAMLWTDGQNRTALLALTVLTGVNQLTETPRVLLVRRVVQRRLALTQVMEAALTTVVAASLAAQGFGLAAILACDVIVATIGVFGLYIWRPVWRPRLRWSPPAVSYFLRMGSRSVLADLQGQLLDRLDDLYTRIFLGSTALGYYSRAYTFASYPRRVLAAPVNVVSSGAYAELTDDRRRLSMAFFRSNALLVRSSFFLAGLMALTAPEFVRLVLGDKWLPMLSVFRLMLVYTLLDPIRGAVVGLFVAVGRPELLAHARALQLAVLTLGLAILGPVWGVTGVALAVNAMLIVGITAMLMQSRSYVDFSPLRLFLAPGIALVVAMIAARLTLTIPGVLGADWRTAAVKTLVFGIVYGGVLLSMEMQPARKMWRAATRFWRR